MLPQVMEMRPAISSERAVVWAGAKIRLTDRVVTRIAMRAFLMCILYHGKGGLRGKPFSSLFGGLPLRRWHEATV